MTSSAIVYAMRDARRRARQSLPMLRRRLFRKRALSPTGNPELVHSLAALVETLTRARALAKDGKVGPELHAVLAQARADLDLADERLLRLDPRRSRSAFRRAARIRASLGRLEDSLSPDPPARGAARRKAT